MTSSARFVEIGPSPGRDRTIDSHASIGREGTDVVLDDAETSRRHAEIVVAEDGSVSVEDLGSRNGTFVNDMRITGSRQLVKGDEVRFGVTTWRLEGIAGAQDRAPEPRISAETRGEVPAPPDPAVSAVHERPAADPAQPPPFTEGREPSRKGSAATRDEATMLALIVVALDAVGLVVFFLVR